MAIIISDMAMPSSCAYCEFGRRLDNVSTICERHPSELPVRDDLGKRPEHCPLKEIENGETVKNKDEYEKEIEELITELAIEKQNQIFNMKRELTAIKFNLNSQYQYQNAMMQKQLSFH